MGISAEQVKNLREMTGAGMMECKKALGESGGDVDKAVKILRTRGLARAKDVGSRTAGEGVIGSYVHAGGRIGSLVEVNCETDFVARTEEFQKLVKELALQVVASRPLYLSRDDVPEKIVEEEQEIALESAKKSGKPENVLEKIVSGKLEKYYAEVCLLEQAYVRDLEKSVKEMLDGTIAKLGENIVVKRFMRFEMGESDG